jgi:hypothetical protein
MIQPHTPHHGEHTMSTLTKTIENTDDLIDVRDIIARVEELEDTIPEDDSERDAWGASDDGIECTILESLLADLKGMGGDEQWRGDWYPITLIRDSYFRDYAQELAEDIGAIPADAGWPSRCIDWDQAARELQQDYSSIEFDGITYWTR